MGLFGAFVLIWLPCAFFAAATAEDKGHGGLAWFFGALFFGPVALIACAGLSDRKLRRYIRLTAENQGVDVSEPLTVTSVANDIIKEKREGKSAVDAFLEQPKMPSDSDD